MTCDYCMICGYPLSLEDYICPRCAQSNLTKNLSIGKINADNIEIVKVKHKEDKK